MIIKAILTGHTRGLGAAIAAQLLARKIAVLGISRHTNTELGLQFHDLLKQVELDLGDTTALQNWLRSDELHNFIADCNTVLLINNAGIVQPVGPLHTQDIGTIAQAINLNVAAPMMLASAVTAASDKAADIRIVHISSGAARSAYPGWSIYCATKAALDQHARAVALDRVPNVRICSLAPGVIDTDMQAEIRATPLEQFPIRTRFDDLKRQGQLASASDCAARLVDFVLHPQFGSSPVADLRES